MATIRELFHSLGNDHNLITVGLGVTKEMLNDFRDEESLTRSQKDKLSVIIKNFDQLTKKTLEADKKVREIHDRVYEVINPDTGKPSN